MIRTIDASQAIPEIYTAAGFDYSKWEAYINAIYKDSAHIFTDEVKQYLESGQYTFEKDFLPILNAVPGNPNLPILRADFSAVTDGLDQRVTTCFGRTLDVDIVLYLGLCVAAGWVTRMDGGYVILLGVEKILELGWHGMDDMYGLIYHELGHVYQSQYGVLERESASSAENFVWQLFTEGIAMYFEQALTGDPRYYHQNKGGWLTWCEDHFQQLLSDFHADLPTMTQFTQRYFGDWCSYHGYGDTGYYLGARFVRYLTETRPFDGLLGLEIKEVYDLYTEFVNRYSL